MATRTKRTYNLSETTVHRVRELAGRPSVASTQDGVVEVAVERLYLSVLEEQEAAAWDAAREDLEFQVEMKALARDYDSEDWPA
jgi:hypothetical protein